MTVAHGSRAATSNLLTRVGWRGSRRARYRASTLVLQLAAGLAPPRSRARAQALTALGVTCKDRGRFAQAEAAYLAAAAELIALPQRDPAAAAALEHNFAGLAHARGDYTGGLPHARAAIALRATIEQVDPTALAADQAVLAALLAGAGRRDEARATFFRVLAITEDAYGPDHYETAVVLHNLAALESDSEQAVQLQQRALTIKRRTLGDAHPEVAAIRANLGVLLERAQRPEAARHEYESALAILQQRWGPDHPATTACRTNLQALAARHLDHA
ncbi:MAG: tetratricopeptide repeat protein [Chloroflexota bacterium]